MNRFYYIYLIFATSVFYGTESTFGNLLQYLCCRFYKCHFSKSLQINIKSLFLVLSRYKIMYIITCIDMFKNFTQKCGFNFIILLILFSFKFRGEFTPKTCDRDEIAIKNKIMLHKSLCKINPLIPFYI